MASPQLKMAQAETVAIGTELDRRGVIFAVEGAGVDEHVEIELGVGVEHDLLDAADAGGAAELLRDLAREGGDRRFAGLDLAAGELPAAGGLGGRRALAGQHATVPHDRGTDHDGTNGHIAISRKDR